MDHPASVQPGMSVEETRELARLAAAMVGVMVIFALSGAAIVLETGDIPSFWGVLANVGAAVLLIHGRPRRPATPRRDGDAAVVASGTLG